MIDTTKNPMTLDQVSDWHRKEANSYRSAYQSPYRRMAEKYASEHDACADAIDAVEASRQLSTLVNDYEHAEIESTFGDAEYLVHDFIARDEMVNRAAKLIADTPTTSVTLLINDPFSWIERYDVLLIWVIIALLIFILSLYGLLP